MQFRDFSLAGAARLSRRPRAERGQRRGPGPVIVTATRTAVTVDESLSSVDVIDHARDRASQPLSVPDLLRGRPASTSPTRAAPAKQTSLFLRGTESDHVLVLIDGVRVGSVDLRLVAFAGSAARPDRAHRDRARTAFEPVRLRRDRRRDPDLHPPRTAVRPRRTSRLVPAATACARPAPASRRQRHAHGWFGVDATRQLDDGINACRGTGAPRYAGCGVAAPDPDRDGYRRSSLSLHGGVRANAALTLEGNALRSEGHNAYDSNPDFGLPDNSDTVQQVVGGRLRYEPGKRFALQLTAGRNVDASDNFLGDTFTDRFESTRDSATLQGDIPVGRDQLLTLGYDWLRDRGAVHSPFASYSAVRGNRAGFAQYQGRFGRTNLQAAVRHDDNDQFGGHDTGSVAWGIEAARGLRFTASAGTAFKAPTFNELYYPFYGNPALRPEASRSVEAAIAQRLPAWHWQLGAYQTTIDDLITYDTAIFAANNLDRARIRGAELTAGATFAGWDVLAHATLADPRNRSRANMDNLLPRRAGRSARLDLDRASGAWRLGGSWIVEGGRWDDVANTLHVGGYATVDLRAEYALARDWTLQGEVRNLFDRAYETAAYYNQPGREFSVSVRWRPVD